jgi:hypothetical protein
MKSRLRDPFGDALMGIKLLALQECRIHDLPLQSGVPGAG